MSYILHENFHIIKTFPSLKGAKIAFARKYKAKYPTAVIDSAEDFNKNEPLVESTNLMNGAPIMIPKSQLGGCCDPGTERYWSM